MATGYLVELHWLYGVGYAATEGILRELGSVTHGGGAPGKVSTVHGGFLKVAAYGGLTSLAAFLIYYGLVTWKLTRCYRSGRMWLLNRASAFSGLLLLCVLFVVNLSADSLAMAITWIGLGFLFSNAFIRSEVPRQCSGQVRLVASPPG